VSENGLYVIYALTARVLATLTQNRDHPTLLTVPESRYLTGLLLQAV
jgi:23S rRNA G2069 N7-methylase RlmK/C1962 C5-methylase RlmI